MRYRPACANNLSGVGGASGVSLSQSDEARGVRLRLPPVRRSACAAPSRSRNRAALPRPGRELSLPGTSTTRRLRRPCSHKGAGKVLADWAAR